jgi:hypothetical protein
MADRKPTVIGSPRVVSIPSFSAVQTQTAAMAPIDTGAIVLNPAQAQEAQQALNALSFRTIQSAEIVKIGLEAEQTLGRTLDGFLQRVNAANSPQLFALFDRLNKGVEDAKLPEVLELVKNPPKPNVLGRLAAKFRGKSALQVAQEAYREVADLLAGRTKTLSDLVTKSEAELKGEISKLDSELKVQVRLKEAYIENFRTFAVQAGIAKAFLEKARQDLAEMEQHAATNPTDVQAQTELQEARTKFALLESRALALEGVYTRLPADQMVIQQIEQAGISTLQETATTMGSRFASIKISLLALHGAFQVRSVQQISERNAVLDRQLTEVRGQVTKEVAVAAAEAPGKNRLAQAQQIETVIGQLREVNTLVASAREKSAQQMQEARAKLQNARHELVQIAQSK